MKFGPQCFNDPFNYLDHDETVEEVDAYADIMLTGTDTNAIFAVSTFAHAVRSCDCRGSSKLAFYRYTSSFSAHASMTLLKNKCILSNFTSHVILSSLEKAVCCCWCRLNDVLD